MKNILKQIVDDDGKCPDDILCGDCPLTDFECMQTYEARKREAVKRLKEMSDEKAPPNLQVRK